MIKQIEKRRKGLRAWETVTPLFQQQYANERLPLEQTSSALQIRMVHCVDRVYDQLTESSKPQAAEAQAQEQQALRENFGAQGQTIVDYWLRLDPTSDIFEKLTAGAQCSVPGPRLSESAVSLRCCRVSTFCTSTVPRFRTVSMPEIPYRLASWSDGKAWNGPTRIGNWKLHPPHGDPNCARERALQHCRSIKFLI
ncbi:hypothetical protein [Burkholderia multivorans]|uniref:hypothetical protein n=1 Tax=Burkholderia multivorans TaxID=87883 RepID=UPI0011329BA9|nr:hypothetical protein [Burkholderia multivorans]